MNISSDGTVDISLAFNGTIGNCSLYALPSGNLSYLVNGSNVYQQYRHDAFPAYFITNCSDDGIDYWLNKGPSDTNISKQIWGESYHLINGGDAFVSLLFTLSGTCVAGWMLCFLLLLSPKHKRRPIMTQIATIFNAIVLTILLSKVNDAARADYYSDHIDVFTIHDVFFNDLTYRVTNVFSEALTSFSLFQIVSRIASKLYQDYVVVGYTIVLIGYVVMSMVCEIEYRTTLTILVNGRGYTDRYIRFHQAKDSLKLATVALVGLLLLYYTTVIKNPRKYCYSIKLLPLAIFVWFLFSCHFVLCICTIAIFQLSWGTRSWLSVIPGLVEIGILTVVWEWMYDIKALERRTELMGVLGRRISFDDDRIFQTSKDDNKRQGRKSRTKIINWVKDKVRFHHPAVDVVDESDNNLKLISTNDSTNISRTISITEGNHIDHNHDDHQPPGSDRDDNSQEYDVEYVNNYDYYHDGSSAPHYGQTPPQEGSSSQPPGPSSQPPGPSSHYNSTPIPLEGLAEQDPPRFDVHPGFNCDDYWPDEK